MKKNFNIWPFVIVLAIGIFLGATFVHAQSVSFNNNLYYGVIHNDDVQALQEFLTTQGDYTGPITGNFYSLTQLGVKHFQKDHSLPVTGYFGVLSRGVANSILAAQSPQPPAAELGSTAQSSGQDSSSPVQSTGSVSVPTTEAVAPPQAPTCTLTAQAVNIPNFGWRAEFTWSFARGDSAVIKWGGGTIIDLGDGSQLNYDSRLYGSTFSSKSPRYYYLFGTTDYEMDVSLNGLTGSCTATASIPN